MEADRGRARVLVIGVGSPLRSDDAAGRHVAQQLLAVLADDVADDVAGGMSGELSDDVEVAVLHQLTPEVADAMTDRALVVIVDASVEVVDVTVAEIDVTVAEIDVTVAEIDVTVADAVPSGVGGPMSHHADVASLVALTALLGRSPERVVTVAVPAADLSLGETLSSATRTAVGEAVTTVRDLCLDVGHVRR